ncbi:MAG: hypothetical protein V1726_06440 [Methanobacteriota archaeon]
MKCEKCGKKINVFNSYRVYYPETDEEKKYCQKCADIIIKEIEEKKVLLEKEVTEKKQKELEEIIAKAPKIKCPYCEKWFPKLTNEQYRDSAELNVLKWALVPAWGVVGALKNRPYIECPHCKMKIMQG